MPKSIRYRHLDTVLLKHAPSSVNRHSIPLRCTSPVTESMMLMDGSLGNATWGSLIPGHAPTFQSQTSLSVDRSTICPAVGGHSRLSEGLFADRAGLQARHASMSFHAKGEGLTVEFNTDGCS